MRVLATRCPHSLSRTRLCRPGRHAAYTGFCRASGPFTPAATQLCVRPFCAISSFPFVWVMVDVEAPTHSLSPPVSATFWGGSATLQNFSSPTSSLIAGYDPRPHVSCIVEQSFLSISSVIANVHYPASLSQRVCNTELLPQHSPGSLTSADGTLRLSASSPTPMFVALNTINASITPPRCGATIS